MSSDDRCGGFVGANGYDSLTSYGHIQGMLDRDQRTAKLRCRSREKEGSKMYQWSTMNGCTYPSYSCCRKNTTTTKRLSDTFRPSWCYLCSRNRRTSRITRTSAYLRRAFQRLKQALIVSVYLLGFVSVPCSLTAPTVKGHNNVMVDRMHSTPKWVNPCNIRHDEETTFAGEAVPNVDLVTQIVHQARIASNYAEQFKEEFAQTMFNTPFEKLHQSWTHVNFNWLPTKEQIPKALGVSLTSEHLESLKLDEILLDAYENLQRIAVGLEQVVWDQEDENGPFADRFMQAEYNLRALLCEIQTAIYERGLQMRPDVTRDIMASDERNNENNTKTSKNLRALIVYRDYMNALEYVIESFTHLKSKV